MTKMKGKAEQIVKDERCRCPYYPSSSCPIGSWTYSQNDIASLTSCGTLFQSLMIQLVKNVFLAAVLHLGLKSFRVVIRSRRGNLSSWIIQDIYHNATMNSIQLFNTVNITLRKRNTKNVQ